MGRINHQTWVVFGITIPTLQDSTHGLKPDKKSLSGRALLGEEDRFRGGVQQLGGTLCSGWAKTGISVALNATNVIPI